METLYIACLIVFFAAVSDGLKCYQCEGKLAGRVDKYSLDCLEAFNPGSNLTPNDIKEQFCTEEEKACFKTISETYSIDGSGQYTSSYVISRGCLKTTRGATEECDEGKSGQGYQSICHCKGDLCNSASANYATFFMLCISIVVLFKLL